MADPRVSVEHLLRSAAGLSGRTRMIDVFQCKLLPTSRCFSMNGSTVSYTPRHDIFLFLKIVLYISPVPLSY
jgi:hypothetical protein